MPSRRIIRAVLLALLPVVAIALGTLMATGGLEQNDKLASVFGLFAALAALAVAVVGLPPAPDEFVRDTTELADDLATTIRAQWLEEAAARSLMDPHMLPLTWSDGQRAGRVDGRFAEVGQRLAERYGDIHSGRLLVLGEPGSGKTVLAIVLTLGLLGERPPGAAVPVLLTASSWDPGEVPLDDWIVRMLATSYYHGRADIPRRLLLAGKILPVLDGVDEIPEIDRRGAVRGINAALGRDRPVVVTCRSTEYAEVVRDGAAPLRKAATVEVRPVAGADSVAYLSEVQWPSGTDWAPVYKALRDRPGSSVAAALSTPLMVSLARMAYQRAGGPPARLLDETEFPDRHSIEDFLVDQVIEAAYAPDPLPTGEVGHAPSGRWSATQARRWLTYLARYTHRHRERDLAWWKVSDRLVSPWVAPAIGVGIGVTLMVAVAGAGALLGADPLFSDLLEIGLGLAALVAVLATALWYGATGREPGRVAFVARGSLGRLRRGFATGVAFVAIPVTPVLVGAVLVSATVGGTFAEVTELVTGILAAVGFAAVAGATVAAHNWLNAPPERSTKAGPIGLVRQDRRATLVGALVAGGIAGLVSIPALALVRFLSEVFGPGVAALLGYAGTARFDRDPLDLGAPINTAAVVLLPALAGALLVSLTRAWPRFVLARLVLAAQGRLPLRLLAFLSDARDRGLLRHSGEVYQFRHVLVQERLHATAVEAAEPVRRPRRVRAVVCVVLLLAATVVTVVTYNHMRCEPALHLGTDVDRVRAFDGTGSHCVGLVPETEWSTLGVDPGVIALLRAGNQNALTAPRHVDVAVVGPLRPDDGGSTQRITEQLKGVTLAQRESGLVGRAIRIVLVSAPGLPAGVEPAVLPETTEVAVQRAVEREGMSLAAVIDLDSPMLSPEPVPAAGSPMTPLVGARQLSETAHTEQVRALRMLTFLRGELGNFQLVPSGSRLGCAGSGDLAVAFSTEVPPRLFLEQQSCAGRPVDLVLLGNVTEDLRSRFQAGRDTRLTVYLAAEGTNTGDRACPQAAADIGLTCRTVSSRYTYELVQAIVGTPARPITRMTWGPRGWITTTIP